MTKQCCICGKTFETTRNKQVTCGAEECKKEQHRRYLRGYMTQYRLEHKAVINQRNKEYMRRVRAKELLTEDTMVALDYAERQRQKTLAMVGRVQI